MGYTHYLTFKKSVTKGKLSKASEDVKKAFELVKSECPNIVIKDGWGENEPQIDDNAICFNGDASKNEDYETFVVKVGDKVKKDEILAEIDASRPGMDYKSSPVKAPVSGTITSFPLNVGATVSASMSIGKISSTGKLEIKTNVAERFISRISMKQKAELTFDAYPGEIFPAVLVEIDPVLDVTSRTLGIKLLQEPADSRLRAGMYARIKLITDTKKNAIVIPNNVVVTRNEQDVVYIVDPQTNKAKMSPVKKGIRVDDKQEILMGIVPGDLVVVKGQALLNDGATVKIVNISE